MKAVKILKICGVAVFILGCIHSFATPFVFPISAKEFKADYTSIFMFVMTGFATILTGWIQIFSMKRLHKDYGYKRIILFTMLFVLIMGVCASMSLPENPFAYITLILGIIEGLAYYKLKPVIKL